MGREVSCANSSAFLLDLCLIIISFLLGFVAIDLSSAMAKEVF